MDKQQPILVSGQELWQWRNRAIADARIHCVPPEEVDWLLQSMTDLDSLQLRLELFKARSQIVISRSIENLQADWQQRCQEHLPVQYIAGSTPWRNFDLEVSKAVLIPRPETEYLIDLVVQAIGQNSQLASGNWIDMGTGSGAIALGVAEALPQAQVYAVDCSPGALEIASRNARKYKLDGRIKFLLGSWWQPLSSLERKTAGVITNPPYIPTKTVRELQPEVVKHEPHLALDGGTDGLDDIRILIASAPGFLIPGGVFLMEMMAGQASIVSELLLANGSYRDIQIHKDLSGIERFAMAWRIDI